MSLVVYVKWWKAWKTFPVLPWIKAARLYRSGEFSRAERFYIKGLRRHAHHPASYSARLDLAYCLFRTRKIAEAEEQLRYVATHAPDTREAHVRLARLQLWTGQGLDAAWTIRRALRRMKADSEMVALFLLGLLDSGGPSFLFREALQAMKNLKNTDIKSPLLEVAQAKLLLSQDDEEKGKEDLIRLAGVPDAPCEALIAVAEILMKEEKIADARQQLRRALFCAPDHPRVLSLMAETYLSDGAFYQPEFARQLANTACQHTNWSSPREMHILAEAYYRLGDKSSALLVASKAKQAGSRLLGMYQGVKSLDKLIETLSSGSQA